MRIGEAIRIAVETVTKEYTKLQRQRIRDAARGERAVERYFRGLHREPSIKDVVAEVLPDAYAKASGDGRYPASARQIFYQVRPLVSARTDRSFDYDYFSQQLLPRYEREHPTETADWDVVYDNRGHLREPHTGRAAPLGTLAVRAYLKEAFDPPNPTAGVAAAIDLRYPTVGPLHRFQDVLYVEKEGFNVLLQAARVAERYDLAIMSAKGESPTAARQLLEETRHLIAQGVRVLVLHDCDRNGFGIVHSLSHDTDRYQYTQPPRVVDLGLRLSDVEHERLEIESVSYGRDATKTLRRYDISARERQWLVNHRVELNAFTSDHFIAWLERKLQQHRVTKVVPDTRTLTAAFRRGVLIHRINSGLKALEREARKASQNAQVPKGLAKKVAAFLSKHPAMAWDDAVAQVAGLSARAPARR